jgi:hypothetical protein
VIVRCDCAREGRNSPFLRAVNYRSGNRDGTDDGNTLTPNHSAVSDCEKDPDGFFGYEIVSLRHMLAVHPAQYPDVKPLTENQRDILRLSADGHPRSVAGDSALPGVGSCDGWGSSGHSASSWAGAALSRCAEVLPADG